VYKKALELGASHFRGPLGNLGSLLTRNFRELEGSGKGASLCGSSVRGGFCLGIWKDMGRRA
jgi:hypothetical protein